MPALPTLDVSQAHYDRIVAAFPGATSAEKASAYRTWLTNHLIDEVESVEIRVIQSEAALSMSTKMAALSANLPPRAPYPPGSDARMPA